MKKFQKEPIKVRILKLARLKSTGSPAELALTLEISERSVKRFVREIKDAGIAIRYSQFCGSYVTDRYYV
jgi:biotin operon repressor